jgi:CBS domain-containing protein
MVPESDLPASQQSEEAYFDENGGGGRSFDSRLLRESLSVLPTRTPLFFGPGDFVNGAMRAMQKQHRGFVLITEDGTKHSPLIGIFTERDVLNKIIGQGRNPAVLRLDEVMVAEPETLPIGASVAWVLNKMSVGGFRHVPVVDEEGHLAFVVSVRDIVQFLVEAFPGEILNLPPEFGASHPPQRDGA